MENLICLDSSIFINHFREKDKLHTFFAILGYKYSGFVISVVAEFEVLIGVSRIEDEIYWESVFLDCSIIPFSSEINMIALTASKTLRKNGQQLEFKDLIIGATAIQQNLPLATLNEKHFDKLYKLTIVTPFSLS